MSDLENALSFGAELVQDNPAPVVAPEPAPQPQVPEPVVEPEPVVAPAEPAEPVAPAPTPAKPEPGYVPLAAVLDEREKRQRAERERDEARAASAQAPVIPSITDDPEGFQTYLDQVSEARQRNLIFSVSERFAVKEHGNETVAAAKEWALTQPMHIRQGFVADEDPIGAIVNTFKREQMLKDIGSDPDAYVRRRAAELGLLTPSTTTAQPTPAAVPNPSPAAARPPRSLAASPNAGPSPATPEVPDNPLEMLTADNLRKRNG